MEFNFTTPAGENGYEGYSEINLYGEITPLPSPVVALTSPTNNSVFSAANAVNLAATVTTNGNTIVAVKFYTGANNLITTVTGPYTYAWNSANAGVSTVFAQLVYDGTNTVNSSSVTITVTNPPPTVGGIYLATDGQGFGIFGTGLSSRPYFLNTATNLMPPVVWIPIQTNLSDTFGNISFTNLAATNLQQFFNISAP
jgi:hypothetical protein